MGSLLWQSHDLALHYIYLTDDCLMGSSKVEDGLELLNILKYRFGGLMLIKIRNMEMEDYDKVYSLWMSCAGMGLNNLDDSRDGIGRFLKRNPDTCLVAEREDKLVGVILAGNDGRRGYIYHTAVEPQYRKQGIARQLVDAALQALKECGINKVALVVFDRNENGNAFWEKLGFSARGDLVYRNKAIAEIIRIDT